MDLFKDIQKGKKFTKKGLKKEARHELKELGGKAKAQALENKIKNAKKGKPEMIDMENPNHRRWFG